MSIRKTGVFAVSKRALSIAAVAGVAGLALAPAAFAADMADAPVATAAADDENEVKGLEVKGEKKNEPESVKYTAPLLDTPQTITVVPNAVIEAQNLLTLRDILSTVPGITFGAGEGGGGYGNSINLRGYSASSDITVDGVRDSAQYTRSDPFNLEQLEVTNGANGAQSGSGSVGGSINLVSKQPGRRDSLTASVAGGTDNYARVTLDANQVLAEGIALRLAAMIHRNDAPGRDVESFKRWGIAPTLSFGGGTNTRSSFAFFHQSDDNVPQYGVPYYNGGPVPGVDPGNYYGYSNVDTQESDVTSYTFKLDHDVSDNAIIHNITRYQIVEQLSIVDPPQGVYCLANGQKPVGYSQTTTLTGGVYTNTFNTSGYAACTGTDPAPGFYAPSGPRGNLRDSRNTTAYTQTDVNLKFMTAGFAHNFVAGASLTSETYKLDGGNVERLSTGATPVFPQINIANPDTVYTGPYNFIRSSIAYGERQNQSIYMFDTIKFSDKWEVNGGIRFDHTEGSNSTDTYIANSTTVGQPLGTLVPGAKFTNSDNLLSYRVGAVFKPVPNASIYVAYGNSQTPSQSAVNGACSAATCNVDPEKAKNYEVGAKWAVFDGKIALTAAAFRNERSNYKVASGDPTLPDQVLQGSSRVDGIALGASGKITDEWALFANYTFLNSEVVQGVSDLIAATTGAGDFTKGDALTNVPDHAFSLFTTYDLPYRIQIGYGATYQGSFFLTQHSAITVTCLPVACTPAQTIRSSLPLVETDPYWVHRLVVTWRATNKAEVRLNVNNVTDEEYYQRGRNNGWATPGDARNATLTLNYRF